MVRKILADGSAAWKLSPKMILFIGLLPFAVAFIGAGTALLGKEAYKWFTGEDGFAESLQVLFYAVTMVMSLVVTRRRAQGGEKLIAWLYLGLSLALFFLIGEELSWGQRIFGWQTAEAYAEINKQAETNLHNVYGVGTTFKWVQLLVGAYGTLLPLVIWRWGVPDRWRKLAAAIVPHYTLIPYFAMLFIWRFYRNLLDPPKAFYFVVAEYNEVLELVLALGFALFLVFQLRRPDSMTSDEGDRVAG